MRINPGGFKDMNKQFIVIGAIIILSTIFLSGCNEQKKPVINSFEAIPSEIELGKTALLQWNVTGATSVTIDNGIGTVMLSGNRTITPTQTTTYILRAISSETMTATTTITVHEQIEQPNITMIQTDFYVEITEVKNARISQSEIQILAINQNNTEDQTTTLAPTVIDGDGNPTFLGSGDIIIFQNLSNYPVNELWDIQLISDGDIVGQCNFKNPKGPYDTPVVRMIQSRSNITIVGIINGPIDQSACSISAINATSAVDQTSLLDAVIINKDNNPAILGIPDQISFTNRGKFRVGDRWTIELIYKGNIIGQCIFTNPTNIIEIPS